MRIVLCYPVEPAHVARIRAVAPDAEVVDAGQERVAAELPEADLFCGHPKVPVPWERVVARGRLRWIQSSAAGLDHCLVPCVVESPIVVTSASGVLADQVAEHALALATACTRRVPLFLEQQARREFVRRPTRDLTGATVGIVGLGGNGRRLVEVLVGLGVKFNAVGGAMFLASVIATQPFWVAGAQATYDQWVEMAALLAIAALPTGGWSGLDFFLKRWCPLARCCGAGGSCQSPA